MAEAVRNFGEYSFSFALECSGGLCSACPSPWGLMGTTAAEHRALAVLRESEDGGVGREARLSGAGLGARLGHPAGERRELLKAHIWL